LTSITGIITITTVITTNHHYCHHHQLSNILGISIFQIQTDVNKILQNFPPTFLDKSKLVIEIPRSYELYVNSSAERPITTEKLECDNIEIKTQGNCLLSQLKSQLITVNSSSGK
jgi:hypothetical protein